MTDEEVGLLASTNHALWNRRLAAKIAATAVTGANTSMRHSIYALRGDTAYGLAQTGQPFMPVPVDEMVPGVSYDFAILPAGEEVTFHVIRPAQTDGNLFIACPAVAGTSIVQVISDLC